MKFNNHPLRIRLLKLTNNVSKKKIKTLFNLKHKFYFFRTRIRFDKYTYTLDKYLLKEQGKGLLFTKKNSHAKFTNS